MAIATVNNFLYVTLGFYKSILEQIKFESSIYLMMTWAEMRSVLQQSKMLWMQASLRR